MRLPGAFLFLLTFCRTSLCSSTPSVLSHRGGKSLNFSLSSSTSNTSSLDQQFYVPSPTTVAPVAKYNCKPLQSQSCVNGDTLIPFTVFVTNETEVTSEVLQSLLTVYLEDDVYMDGFLKGGIPQLEARSVKRRLMMLQGFKYSQLKTARFRHPPSSISNLYLSATSCCRHPSQFTLK
jgi:hypothetical protein